MLYLSLYPLYKVIIVNFKEDTKVNIRDFSLNDVLTSFNNTKIGNRPQHSTTSIQKKEKSSAPFKNEDTVSTGRKYSRERINIRPENKITAADGSVYDRTAPRGSYIDIEV